MRSPKDELLDLPEVDAPAVGTRDLKKPEGGKALARLQFFNQERSMAATFSTEAEEDSGKKKTKSRDVAEDTGSEYAEACISASAALQAPETASRDVAMGQGSDDLSALSPPTAAGPNWRFLGPVGMNNGQTYGDTRVHRVGSYFLHCD